MDQTGQHFCGFFVIGGVIRKSGNGSRLIMIIQEQRVPAVCLLHSLLPGLVQTAKFVEIRRFQRPFIAIFVVDLEMMEAEYHCQLMLLRIRVTNTVRKRGGRHLTDRDVSVKPAFCRQALEILMNVGTIRIESASIPFVIVLKYRRFGNQIHDVEPESLYPLALPEPDDICELCTDLGVIPVEIRLADVKEVQIIFSE